MNNLNLVLPEIFISISIMFLLVLGVFKKDSSKLIFNISLIVLFITLIITFNETFAINRKTLFNDSVVIDYMSSLMKIITLIATFLVLVISSSYLKTTKIFKIDNNLIINSQENLQLSIFTFDGKKIINQNIFAGDNMIDFSAYENKLFILNFENEQDIKFSKKIHIPQKE